MELFEPRDPDFAARVRADFARQGLMATLGAELVDVSPGAVTISMPFRADLTQQHGYLHAGAITVIVDSACGFTPRCA
ncbi:MAG TPA: PaaI family thioesterase [Nitrolancea sp.]|nr:PaaI family thioesterase [Nitrolancea sp.]